jgi:hypothetical protein
MQSVRESTGDLNNVSHESKFSEDSRLDEPFFSDEHSSEEHSSDEDSDYGNCA